MVPVLTHAVPRSYREGAQVLCSVDKEVLSLRSGPDEVKFSPATGGFCASLPTRKWEAGGRIPEWALASAAAFGWTPRWAG